MSLSLRKASRAKVMWKVLLSGPSGSGKTYSAILLAKGLAKGDLAKVALIEAGEHNSDLYSDLGEFNVLSLTGSFHPNRLVEAIKLCVSEGMEVIIIDSLSAFWEGKDGILELQQMFERKISGNDAKFRSWNEVKPIENHYRKSIMEAPVYVVATCRTKNEVALVTKPNGKQVREKIGLKPVQRDGVEFDFDIAWLVDQKHRVKTDKDRTGKFMPLPPFLISEETGEILIKLNEGMEIRPQTKTLTETEKQKEAEIRAQIKERSELIMKSAETVGYQRDREKLTRLMAECRYAEILAHMDYEDEEIMKIIQEKAAEETRILNEQVSQKQAGESNESLFDNAA